MRPYAVRRDAMLCQALTRWRDVQPSGCSALVKGGAVQLATTCDALKA